MDPTLLNAVEPDWRQALTDAGFDEVISLGDDDPATAGVVIAGRKPVGPSQPVVRESDPTVWLVLSAKRFAAPASILTQQLDNSDRQIILVDEGERFERLGLSRFAAPAGDRDSYARLLQLLAVDGIGRLHDALELASSATTTTLDVVRGVDQLRLELTLSEAAR